MSDPSQAALPSLQPVESIEIDPPISNSFELCKARLLEMVDFAMRTQQFATKKKIMVYFESSKTDVFQCVSFDSEDIPHTPYRLVFSNESINIAKICVILTIRLRNLANLYTL